MIRPGNDREKSSYCFRGVFKNILALGSDDNLALLLLEHESQDPRLRMLSELAAALLLGMCFLAGGFGQVRAKHMLPLYLMQMLKQTSSKGVL